MTKPDNYSSFEGKASMRWFGEPGALVTGTSSVTAISLPAWGGKIVSLFDRKSERQWLLQPNGPLPNKPTYGDDFVAAGLFGWDEMVPTVDSCPNEDGQILPDHGEVWSGPWRVIARSPNSATMEVSGRAIPYRLVRELNVGATAMRLTYRLTVEGEDALPIMWTAHPQFVVGERSKVLLPEGCETVIDTYPEDGNSLPRRTWSRESETFSDVPAGQCRMSYVDPECKVETVTLVDEDGTWLRLSWDPASVPYLGIWCDNRALAHRTVVGLEPSTGFYDRLDRAIQLHRVPIVTPGLPVSWYIDLECG
jgi:galactose mutarotase-like enzyme